MKKLILLPFVFLILLISFSCGSNNTEEEMEEVVVEEVCNIVNKDGLLIIEAESFDLKGAWRIVEDDKASEGKYIEYYGPNSYNTQNLNNEISVKFKIKEAAGFTVKWFMRQPDHVESDLSNDTWIYFTGDYGGYWEDGSTHILTKYEKFVSRGKGEFTYGGQLDLHSKAPWMSVSFPEAGEYTLKLCGRSSLFQLDKIVLYNTSFAPHNEAETKSKPLTETIECTNNSL